jgi:hypothetical protein
MEQRFQLDDLEVLEVAQVLLTSYQEVQESPARDMPVQFVTMEIQVVEVVEQALPHRVQAVPSAYQV